MWVNSLQVGELVDICSEDLHHEWSLGIIESIKTENGLVVSLSVIVEQADDCQDGNVGMDIHSHVVVITEVNHRSVSRPFLMYDQSLGNSRSRLSIGVSELNRLH